MHSTVEMLWLIELPPTICHSYKENKSERIKWHLPGPRRFHALDK